MDTLSTGRPGGQFSTRMSSAQLQCHRGCVTQRCESGRYLDDDLGRGRAWGPSNTVALGAIREFRISVSALRNRLFAWIALCAWARHRLSRPRLTTIDVGGPTLTVSRGEKQDETDLAHRHGHGGQSCVRRVSTRANGEMATGDDDDQGQWAFRGKH